MEGLKELFADIQTKNTAISPREARQMMKESNEFVLLDVRTPQEYNQIRIDGAKLIPVDELAVRAPAELPDKHIPVLVYCHSGARAGTAVKSLRQMGYENAFSFGGILNWPYETVKEGEIKVENF